MGSLISSILTSIASWKIYPGEGAYTVLGDTSGFFYPYLQQPSDKTSSGLAKIPSLLKTQLSPGKSRLDTPRHWPDPDPITPSELLTKYKIA